MAHCLLDASRLKYPGSLGVISSHFFGDTCRAHEQSLSKHKRSIHSLHKLSQSSSAINRSTSNNSTAGWDKPTGNKDAGLIRLIRSRFKQGGTNMAEWSRVWSKLWHFSQFQTLSPASPKSHGPPKWIRPLGPPIAHPAERRVFRVVISTLWWITRLCPFG